MEKNTTTTTTTNSHPPSRRPPLFPKCVITIPYGKLFSCITFQSSGTTAAEDGATPPLPHPRPATVKSSWWRRLRRSKTAPSPATTRTGIPSEGSSAIRPKEQMGYPLPLPPSHPHRNSRCAANWRSRAHPLPFPPPPCSSRLKKEERVQVHDFEFPPLVYGDHDLAVADDIFRDGWIRSINLG